MRHAVSSASRGSKEKKKRQGRQIEGEKDERGAMQSLCSFKCKHGLQGRKRRGAKLTEKRTRGAPCSFKCKQVVPGKKTSGRQIDGGKDERVAMQFQVEAGAPGKKTSETPN